MSKLLDGPAGPLDLWNACAPRFLRVVVNAEGKVDCLDRLWDEPASTETIHVYRLVDGTFHGISFLTLARPRRCVQVATGDYRYLPDVDGAAVRDNEAWRAWMMAQ